MLSIELIASSVVPLLVALFNLLLAGYALTKGLEDRRKLTFAAGPAGVGIWALAWFISLFEVSALESIRIVATSAGVLSIFGFAADAILDLEGGRRRTSIAAVVLLFAVLYGATFFALKRGPEALSVARLFALALSIVTVSAQFPGLRSRDAATKTFARWMIGAATMTVLVSGYVAVSAFITERAPVDPLLLVILLSELFTLVYIVRRRVEVHVLLSRAVTYAILSIITAVLAAFTFSQLGYAVDPVIITVTVSISLAAAVLFMGLSPRLSLGVERLLFPEQARLERALLVSRGELKALRRRLERAEKLAIAGELAASVAHEIKNPLSPIRGYAQLLQGKLGSIAPAERAVFEKGLSIIREETERIDHRVQQLLQASRAERETASCEDSLDLNRVAIEASAVAEGEAGAIKIVQRLDPALVAVIGNEDEMRGALLNLIKNAIEAMQSTGGQTVEVITRREGATAIVEVIDEGTGVSPKDSERAFDAFYTTKKGGTGLGLAIARSAVEAAGGTISLEDRKDRRGAVVRVVLDLAPLRLDEEARAS